MADMNIIREDLDRLNTSISGSEYPWAYPIEGITRVRFLPKIGNSREFYELVGRHRIPGAQTTFICRNLTFGQPCPICEVYETFSKSNNPQEKELAKKIRPYWRAYTNAIIRGWKPDLMSPQFIYPENYPKVSPVILVLPSTVIKAILNLIASGEYGDITDLQNGRDIDIIRTSVNNRTEYSIMPAPNPSPLVEDPAMIDAYMNAGFDLGALKLELDVDFDELNTSFVEALSNSATQSISYGKIAINLSSTTPPPLPPTTPTQQDSPAPLPSINNQTTSPPSGAGAPTPTPTPTPTQPTIPTPQPTTPTPIPQPNTPIQTPTPPPPPTPTPTEVNPPSPTPPTPQPSIPDGEQPTNGKKRGKKKKVDVNAIRERLKKNNGGN